MERNVFKSSSPSPATSREVLNGDQRRGFDAEARTLRVRGVRRRQMNFESAREPHFEPLPRHDA